MDSTHPQRSRLATRLANLWSKWRQDPWDLPPFLERPLRYRVWLGGVMLVQACVLLAALVLAPGWFILPDPSYLAVAVALLLYVALQSHRIASEVQWSPEVVAILGLCLAGMFGVALAGALVVTLVMAIRKPLVPHLVLSNGLLHVTSVVGAATVFSLIGTSLKFDLDWVLASALSFLILGLNTVLVFDVTLWLTKSRATWIEFTGDAWSTLSRSTPLLPLAMGVGLALQNEHVGYLVSLLAPYTIARQIFVRSERVVHLHELFSRYVPASMVDIVVKQSNRIELGGSEQEISVLFCDIRGFTSWSESLPAPQVIEQLNELLGDLTDAVFATGGTLDKFTGDGLMAFWGAPLDQPNHADRACRTALGMVQRLEARNTSRVAAGLPTLAIGVGVHSGTAVVGNVGHAQRHDYTAIGDTVNLSARLEAATKEVGHDIVISLETHMLLGTSLQDLSRRRGTIRVKGRTRPVEVFSISNTASATNLAV